MTPNPDEMLKALLPCPFCGAEPFKVPQNTGLTKPDAWKAVWCPQCKALGPEASGANPADVAIERWNQRASIQPADDAVVERKRVELVAGIRGTLHRLGGVAATGDWSRQAAIEIADAALAALAPQGEKGEG